MPTGIVRIKLDGDLTMALKTNAEVKKIGVSEFVLRAIRSYLKNGDDQNTQIHQRYQQGYSNADLTELTLEMQDWEEEQVWPAP